MCTLNVDEIYIVSRVRYVNGTLKLIEKLGAHIIHQRSIIEVIMERKREREAMRERETLSYSMDIRHRLSREFVKGSIVRLAMALVPP